MKAAFAKLLQVDPVQSSLTDFRAGGNGVPILTRASGQSTAGYQTMGLPGGNKPFPGGGANKTVLGSIRMGDDEGNGPASAIVGGVGEIFFPFRAPDRTYPERTFPNVGNNVFQPDNNEAATISLLRRLGDQKFKAESQAPFEDYRAQQRLARDLEEASRGASLADLQQSRDIIRGIAADRRQQNEDDYLRKMLDAGATPEAARKEIEDVRNANALQEARKVDDRQYQAKMLIQRVAMARGIVPNVREPLNQSSSIDNPQRSQAMSAAMGMPGEGFGTSPLDVNRLMMTPEYYKKILRRSQVSQEASDEAVAFNNSLQGLGDQDKLDLSNAASGFSLATVKGQERQLQIEMASEALASRLDNLRQRSLKIKKALPDPIVGEDKMKALYSMNRKAAGNKVFYTPETIQELNPLQLLIALNVALVAKPSFETIPLAESAIRAQTWGSGKEPDPNWLSKFREVVYLLNNSEQSIRIPYASSTVSDLKTEYIIDLMNSIKNGSMADFRNKVRLGRENFIAAEEISTDTIPTEPGGVPQGVPRAPRPAPRNTTRGRSRTFDMNEVVQAPATSAMAQRPLPGAGSTVVSAPTSVRPARVAAFAARAAASAAARAAATAPAPAPASVRPARVAAFAARAARAAAPPATPLLTREGVSSLTLEQIRTELTNRGIDKGEKKSIVSLRKLLKDNL